MAAATLRPQMTAATEHGQEVLRLQSTAMSANVVFINIDWKASRHNKTLEANMKLLGLTIAGVVRNMKPAMVCMCEVGVASIPLTKEQMQQVADQSMQAWRDAATEHVQLHCMFEVGAPYMTIYIDGSVQCSCHRILEGLYNAQGLPRTAQTFLCCGPGGVAVDVINVHAPSGKKRLTNQQRQTLLTNLLQSNSKSMPGQTIGSARFLIGGDMNTAPFLLSQVLQACRGNGSLRTQAQIHDPVLGNHGDLCVLGGFKADSLTTTAKNHDLQHKPYGICWSMAQWSATPKIPTRLGYGPVSKGYATEQRLQITPYSVFPRLSEQIFPMPPISNRSNPYFRAGAAVRIHGLQNHKEFNGFAGTCVNFVDGFWRVKFVDIGNKTLRIDPRNLVWRHPLLLSPTEQRLLPLFTPPMGLVENVGAAMTSDPRRKNLG